VQMQEARSYQVYNIDKSISLVDIVIRLFENLNKSNWKLEVRSRWKHWYLPVQQNR